MPICTTRKIDLKQRLEKQVNDVNSFNNSNINSNERITYFKDKNHQSEKNEIYKNLNTISKSVDNIVNIGATSTSIPLSITGLG